jgi:glucosamine--fructose-6-phosphate aminotransferase (isomerizing)
MPKPAMTSLLHSEISEQPVVIRRLLDKETDRVAQIGASLAKQDIRYVVMAARGTSDNAARYAQYVFGAQNRLTVALATPSLFSVYDKPPRLDGALVIGISQSGQSPDIVSVLQEAHRQGAPTIAVTNEPQSPLAAAATHVIELHAGEERSVAATKTYTAQLAALALLSLSLTGALAHSHPLEAIPDAMQQALGAEAEARAAAERIASSNRCVVVGRGFNYATTFEIALKMKELSYVEAEPYSSADFMHGPIAMVERGFPVVLVQVGQTMRAELTAMGDSLRGHGVNLVVLGDDRRLQRSTDAWLSVPHGLPEWLTPLVAIVPGQLLAFHLTLARGRDPDQPRTIHKVTLTH